MTRPVGGEVLVVGLMIGFPLAVGGFEDVAEAVGEGFVGAEDAEVSLVVVELDDVAEEGAEDAGVFGFDVPPGMETLTA